MQAQKSEIIYKKKLCYFTKLVLMYISEHEKIRVLFSPMRCGIFLDKSRGKVNRIQQKKCSGSSGI